MELGGFQKTVLIIAVVILLGMLMLIGSSIVANQNNQTWPPSVPSCPDWWVSDGSGNTGHCINKKDLGTRNIKSKNFNTPAFTGSNGTCNKYKWAKKCKVSWDGITYGVDNPCN